MSNCQQGLRLGVNVTHQTENVRRLAIKTASAPQAKQERLVQLLNEQRAVLDGNKRALSEHLNWCQECAR